MTPSPKEKAKELVDMYYWIFGDGYLGEQHIQCAKIAVNLVISTIPTKPSKTEMERLDAIMYWLEAKQELENYNTKR